MAELGVVMIVDDEEIDQRLYRRIISRSGLADDIVQFTDAQQALDWLAEDAAHRVDLLLLDINMPNMTGFDCLDALHALPGGGGIGTVIMLSTSCDPRDEARAFAYPMVKAYFTKPLSTDHLDQAVQVCSGNRNA